MADPNRVTLPEVRVVSEPPKSYALSGKIMLCAVVVLFAVVVFMAGLQLYAKWYVFRLRLRRLQRRASRSLAVECVDGRGLDPAVLKSLSVFVHALPSPPMECAVCISEFLEGETGRVLPNCGHTFHTECIDMWFGSHSTCPLCRTPVEKPDVEEPGSSSGSGDPDRIKDAEMSVEAPARSRSTVKRMLSMGKRSIASTPESTGEVDLESGPGESDRVRTPS